MAHVQRRRTTWNDREMGDTHNCLQVWDQENDECVGLIIGEPTPGKVEYATVLRTKDLAILHQTPSMTDAIMWAEANL